MDNNFMNEYNLNINMDVEILNKYWVSQKKKRPTFDLMLSWKLLYLHNLILYFLNPHTST